MNCSQTVVKKFRFGAGSGEIANEQLAIEQMRSRNFFRNELVAIDRSTREKYNAILNVENIAHDRIRAINDEIKGLRDTIKLMRIPKSGERSGKHRVKVGFCPEKDLITGLKKERDDLKPVALAIKQANKSKSADELRALKNERVEAIKVLYNRAIAGYLDQRTGKQVPPLYSANTDEIKAQHEVERLLAMKAKTQLRYHRFVGEGRSFVRVRAYRENEKEFATRFMPQINALKERWRAARGNEEVAQGLTRQIADLQRQANHASPLIIGQTEEETFSGQSTLFRIDPVKLTRDASNPSVWDKLLCRGERRRRMHTVAHIRIQSDEKRHPIWIDVPIVLHRPFPCGAKILSAAVNREKIGSKFRWNVEFTVKYEEAVQETVGRGFVAVDLGWAKESLPYADGRIRVAGVLVRNAKGQETFSEFCLPPFFHDYQQKLNDIHSIRDEKTHDVFAKIEEYRSNHVIADESLKNLLDEAKRSLAARKSVEKEPPVYHLRRVVWMFRKEELKANFDLRDILESWYARWNHLNEWLINGRDNLLARKKDYYRRWAHELSESNGLLLIDADNFARMARTPHAEEDKKTMKGGLRQTVAPGMLRSSLIAAFEQTLWATNISSSRKCRRCHKINEGLGAGRLFTCASCGYEADREANASGNIMDEYLAHPGSFSSNKNVSERLAEKNEQEAAEASELHTLVASESA